MKTDRCARAFYQQQNACAAHESRVCGGMSAPSCAPVRCARLVLLPPRPYLCYLRGASRSVERVTHRRARYRFILGKSSHDVRIVQVPHCDFLNWIWLIAAMFALRSRNAPHAYGRLDCITPRRNTHTAVAGDAYYFTSLGRSAARGTSGGFSEPISV
jgi:hypothetical protein